MRNGPKSDQWPVAEPLPLTQRCSATCSIGKPSVGDVFTPQGNDVEWMMYGWSILHCLPVGRADPPAAGAGTVMRADTLRAYAREAGFRAVEVLPIDSFFFRFYRLIA